jgi:transcriptional regulator with XRE-family HTH domain
MVRRARTQTRIAGSREAAAIAATLGGVVRSSRRTRRWTIQALAGKVGLSTARLSEIERGLGARAPLETWIAIGIALERPIAVAFSRPLGSGSAAIDAGHLQIQEHILRLARTTGRPGTFELPTRPADPSRSTDVGIRDAVHGARVLVECWNTFGDLGAAVRATRRKEHEAASTWPEERTASVWVVRATATNRALLARYPEVVDAAFPGSSRAWLRALNDGGPPPIAPGIVWFDPATDRLLERRSRILGESVGPALARCQRATIAP